MMPPVALWVQYSLIGILVLATSAIALGFYRLWKDMLKWLAEQEAKREAERSTQREWQAKQDLIRDERWHAFLKSMQEGWMEQDVRHTTILEQLSARVDMLIMSVNNHDVWTRAKDRTP